MAVPVSGSWVRAYGAIPYASTNIWGTGINPVHAVYGSDPERLRPIHAREGENPPTGPITSPAEATPEAFGPETSSWGYTREDDNVCYNGIQYDSRPDWGQVPEDYRGKSVTHPPWDASGASKEQFRATVDGAQRTNPDDVNSLPTETVSEGWLNKPKGDPADGTPSSPDQYEMQTSMQQRYRRRGNANAVFRGTDEDRTDIESRVVGQKLKVYSEGERHWDMYPREQNDVPRAFYYRTAGTGRQEDMFPNSMYEIDPIQRTTPSDPGLGLQETAIPQEYGYTGEDALYA